MKRVLLISVQGIGNTVLMMPLIVSLRAAGYEVDVVVSDNGSQRVVRLCPGIQNTYVWHEQTSALSNLWRLRAELRRRKYDVAWALYPNGRRENALLFLTRASLKSRYAHSKHRIRLLDFLPPTRKLSLNPGHDVANNFSLIRTTDPQVKHSQPKLSIDAESRAFAAEFFERHGLQEKFVIALHPGGGGVAKQWSEAKFTELCRRLAKDPSIAFLICGSQLETNLVGRMKEAIGSDAIAVSGEAIDRVAALLANCRLLVANDSALAHIASALDVPVVTVWGYTDFRRVASMNENAALVRIDYPCNPCYEFATGYIEDCQYHLKCIKDISVDQMHQVVRPYISTLQQQESLSAEIFNGSLAGAGIERFASGCFKIDLRPPATSATHV